MKRTIRKITTVTILAAAILALPALSRAEDTNTPAAANQSGPTKFYGTITAVDTNAMTFAIGDDTYTVTGESQLTKDGKPATLADAVVGEPARGSYTKGTDGKLDITKVRFGKGGKGGKGGGKKKKDSATTDSTTTNTPPQN